MTPLRYQFVTMPERESFAAHKKIHKRYKHHAATHYGEKLAESEEDLLEHRTDGTDAFDTLYIGAEKFPYHDSFALSVSGVS